MNKYTTLLSSLRNQLMNLIPLKRFGGFFSFFLKNFSNLNPSWSWSDYIGGEKNIHRSCTNIQNHTWNR